jgi:hypothetical protein
VDADETLSIDGKHAIESNILAGQVLKEIVRLREAQREAVLLVRTKKAAPAAARPGETIVETAVIWTEPQCRR